MRILIAEDDPVSRRVLEATLEKWGHELVVATDGQVAWEQLEAPDPPRLLVLDWNMPIVDGTELCRRLRERPDGDSFYILLLTAKTQKDDIVEGLEAGADDYLTKPFHHEELRARIASGERIVDLEQRLSAKIGELEQALAEVSTLSGLLPICSYCRKVRDNEDYWSAVEEYVARRSEAEFTHGVCPDCYEKHIRPQLEEV